MTSNSVLSMKEMLCPLCGCVYDEPTMLACLHNYCFKCLSMYFSHTTDTNKLICPQCKMETVIGLLGLESLPVNSFVKRQIKEYGLLNAAPMQSDCENENGELTKMSLSSTSPSTSSDKDDLSLSKEDERKESPMSESDSDVADDSYNNTIDSLHNKYLQLQTKALQITYAIDSVNQSVEDWKENRSRVQEDIQQRSQYLQSLIRLLERKLLSELDSSSHMSEIMNEVTNTKEKLQDTLKLTLYNIQFIRHLINSGLPEDITCLGKSVLTMKAMGSNQDISLRFPEYKVACSHLKQESHLEDAFGELSKTWKEKVIMSANSDDVQNAPVDQLLSDNPADFTQSMYADTDKHTQETQAREIFAKPSTNVASKYFKERNLSDSGITETGNISQVFFTDAEKNIYLKYEMAKKNVEKRRRELAVKHMIENKSRSYDEASRTNIGSNNMKTLKDQGNLNFNKIGEEISSAASSESNLPIVAPHTEKHSIDEQKTRRWSSDSPLMAAQVTMARSKVSAVLRAQSACSNPALSNTSDGMSTSPTAKKRSPTNMEVIEGIDPLAGSGVGYRDDNSGGVKDTGENEKIIQIERRVRGERSLLDAESEKGKRISRDLYQEIKENARRKSERWRSVPTLY
ncbi:hypothetical protein Ahia01_000336800 [Argonauta hians]